jgi:DNA repair protein RadA/Sms
VRVDEPGADLAVALAVASAARGIAADGVTPSSAPGSAPPGGAPLVAFGEVGLTGEIRSVGHADRRRQEAAKFGLRRVLGPPGSEGAEVRTLRDAVRAALGTGGSGSGADAGRTRRAA